MAQPYSIQKPNNKIVALGVVPIEFEMKLGDAAGALPGSILKKGADDNTAIKTTASTDSAMGVLGYEQASPQYRPTDINTAYAQNDLAKVLCGGGFMCLMILDTSQTIAFGDYLMASAANAGRVIKATSMTTATGGTSVTSSAATAPIVGCVTGTPCVGQAYETITTTGSPAFVLAKCLL